MPHIDKNWIIQSIRGLFIKVSTFLQLALCWIAISLGILAALLACLCIITLLWDSAVWLFNTNWKTSHFQIPLRAGIAAVAFFLLSRLAGALLPEVED
jgi:hypothetical protein